VGDVSVAVIGSKGFVGRALVPSLRAAGMSVVEFPSARPFLRSDGSPTDDLAGASAVCYLASRINPAIAERDPGAAAAHLATLRSLAEALRGSGKRLLYPSSGGTVYDTRREPPYEETSPLQPIGRFGATKVEAERLLFDTPGIETVAMRISNAYGPGQRTGTGLGVVAHWVSAASRGEALRIFGAPEKVTRDFVYIDDVCSAFLRVLAADAPPPVVNIGSGTPTTLAEVAEIILGLADEAEVAYEPDRGFDVTRSWLDIGLARRELGWEPTIELAEGIRRTWEHALRQAERREVPTLGSTSVEHDR
jgi:UDP-glucose 4-epimerase